MTQNYSLDIPGALYFKPVQWQLYCSTEKSENWTLYHTTLNSFSNTRAEEKDFCSVCTKWLKINFMRLNYGKFSNVFWVFQAWLRRLQVQFYAFSYALKMTSQSGVMGHYKSWRMTLTVEYWVLEYNGLFNGSCYYCKGRVGGTVLNTKTGG